MAVQGGGRDVATGACESRGVEMGGPPAAVPIELDAERR